MGFAVSSKNTMLDAIEPDGLRLHSGDPGAAGANNALGAGISAASFNAAFSGSRTLASNVTVTGLSANQSVTHVSFWDGATFVGAEAVGSGDTQANAAGEYIVNTGTTLSLSDS